MIYLGMMFLFVVTVVFMSWEFGRRIEALTSRFDAERVELQDRIMALSQPTALTHVKAVRDDVVGTVTYMDDKKEIELDANA